MKIAIFGGSFNPVHSEHIRMAKCAVQELALDTLFVMPAHTPPHKKGALLAPNEDRLNACRIAFENDEKIVVSDYEISQGGTSYTYLTCRRFRALYPDAEIFWLVGTDMLRDFPTWKNPKDIYPTQRFAFAVGRNSRAGWKKKTRSFTVYSAKNF